MKTCSVSETTFAIIVIILVSVNIVTIASAHAQTPDHVQGPKIVLLVNEDNFTPGSVLVVYGKTFANDTLIVRMYDPAGKAVRIESVKADINGSYSAQIFTWPQPTTNFVFGHYTVEATSSIVPTYKESRTILFSNSLSASAAQPQFSLLSIKLDSPTQISVGKNFRIFVQVTFDGALVNVDDPDQLLSSSHIHSGNDTINLAGKFVKLHEGIYYADVKLDKEGTYIIHAIAFYKGFLSHDSKVVSSGSSIGDIQDSVNSLKTELDKTSHELNSTRSDITQSVNDARAAINEDLKTATGTVDQLKDASGQINSLILPILALISVIIALQISLFARIRASFK